MAGQGLGVPTRLLLGLRTLRRRARGPYCPTLRVDRVVRCSDDELHFVVFAISYLEDFSFVRGRTTGAKATPSDFDGRRLMAAFSRTDPATRTPQPALLLEPGQALRVVED